MGLCLFWRENLRLVFCRLSRRTSRVDARWLMRDVDDVEHASASKSESDVEHAELGEWKGLERFKDKVLLSCASWRSGCEVPMWLDCDPGHDDAFAMYAAAKGELCGDGCAPLATCRLMGVSTVTGNQTIQKTTTNAARVLEWLELGTDLFMGASKPLLRESKVCEEIHGESGLDTRNAIDALPHVSADEVIRRTLVGTPPAFAMYQAWKTLYHLKHRLVIVATGPLTNVATFCLAFDDIICADTRGESFTKGPKIIFMGGAIGEGNTGSRAEFNIQCDPEAAKIVLESSFEVIMVPLEVTHTALVTEDVLCRLEEAATKGEDRKRVGNIRELLNFFKMTYKQVFGFENPPLHDPCAVFCAMTEHFDAIRSGPQFQDAFTGRMERVDVECQSDLTYGQTVIDCWGTSTKPKNVKVMTKMNVEKFWKFMCDSIRAHTDFCESKK